MVKTITQKVFEKALYITNGMETVRTEPRDASFVGFIRTVKGESEVTLDNDILNSVLRDGREITKEEYNNTKPSLSTI